MVSRPLGACAFSRAGPARHICFRRAGSGNSRTGLRVPVALNPPRGKKVVQSHGRCRHARFFISCLSFLYLISSTRGSRAGAHQCRVGPLAQRRAHTVVFARRAFGGRTGLLCVRIWMGRVCWRAGAFRHRVGKTLELDCRGAVLFSQNCVRRFAQGPGCAVANLLRGPRGADSTWQRRGPLAAAFHLPFNSHSGGFHVSALRALGVGRRLARATGRALRAGTRVPGCRRRWNNSCPGRADGSFDHVDSRSPPRKIFG